MGLRSYKFFAGLLSFIVLILCLVSPLLFYPLVTGVSWDSDVPDWLIWFVILGGALGAGLAVLIHRFIICSIGGYPEHIALKGWHDRYK